MITRRSRAGDARLKNTHTPQGGEGSSGTTPLDKETEEDLRHRDPERAKQIRDLIKLTEKERGKEMH